MESNAELRFDTAGRGPDGATPERLKRQLSRLMGMTSAQIRKIANEAMGAIGASKDHFVVLAALAEFGPASQAQLSDRTRVYRSDLVAVLNELADGGWIRRAPDPADKRRNVITITEAGAERLAELDAILEGVNERVMAPLGPGEREQLFALLGRINAHLAAGG
ncbi:MarR family transcriptional regulator [Glycomyces sp. TRM65418]|uniref:MarR family winged helix-turn-helix transcriptional regulator n=1 Tax=Glycomyces sp. TRM65418 TaxID=2867006 RepID=UPI001CE68970|nr:MarR family transcriptional regulator [Glycomyces sp. TRM65418]MCC3764589.1 MarR family transcriptional regulator [Glycomyces sp. TRM65418]QZD54253.1 MarR family transcriptional regulator [Glycomyces sp. TRM65418]